MRRSSLLTGLVIMQAVTATIQSVIIIAIGYVMGARFESIGGLAVVVAVSRVWLGVHWASDVVAGLALAVVGVAAVERWALPCRACCPPGARVSADGHPNVIEP